jgi:hypothetical protein
MQHFCAYRWNPRGPSWTGPSPAARGIPIAALNRPGWSSGCRTWSDKTSESRSIKANQGQSRWIKPNNIVFENEAAGNARRLFMDLRPSLFRGMQAGQPWNKVDFKAGEPTL